MSDKRVRPYIDQPDRTTREKPAEEVVEDIVKERLAKAKEQAQKDAPK